MSLSLQTNFTTQPNLVMPLAQNANGLTVRVASQSSGSIGTLTATGAQGTPTFSLKNAPSFVTLSVSSGVATLNFASATYQPDPYAFFVSCTDGQTTVTFPVVMEVRQPFYIAAVSGNPVVVDGQTLNIPSYDSSVADIVIQGYGLFNTQQSNVSFILPNSLPTGLNVVTSDESKLVLRVADATYSDMSGGLKTFNGTPTAIPLTIYAYQPDSFYDTPDRAYPLNISVGSQSAATGTLDFGIGARYDTANNVISFDAEIDVLLGALKNNGVMVATPLKYTWQVTDNAAGLTLQSGGGSLGTNKFATYTVSGTGTAAVTLTVTDNNGVPITGGVKTISFNQISQTNTSWLATNAIKIGVSADKVKGYLGDTLNLTVSSPDGFNPAETLTFTLTVEAESGIESGYANNPTVSYPGSPGAMTLDAGNPTRTVTFQFPATAKIGNKWVLKLAATDGGTRNGYAQVLYECSGKPALAVGGIGTTINSNTGASINPIQLTATDNDPNSPTYGNTVAATFELVGGAEFGANIYGAPDGLYINNQNQLVGNALKPGTYKFAVAASATNYARGYSSVVTMTVSQVATPLTITNPTSQAVSIQDNTSFSVSWGISGSASKLYMVQLPSPTPIRDVTGTSTATVQQVGSNVYSIYGTSYYGNAYSVPLVVISSSIGTAQKLLSAPTIATIDDSNLMTVNWQPYAVSGDYTVYKGWNLTVTEAALTPQVIFTDGLNFGGSASARAFQTQLNADDYSLNMQGLSNDYALALDSNPWDVTHSFPAQLGATNVSFDNTTLLLGQTMTITLQDNYTGADAWQVIYPDNTSTGWLPLSTKAVAKAFNTAGALNVIIQTQKDFGTSNPPVKLRRQFTQQIFVMDQQFNPQAAAEGALTGTLGIGGEQGFEITDATGGSATPQPYEVVVRAIARDTVSNELKLMVATTRFSNASSLLGTMAIDVFPIAGRPHVKELIEPIYILEPTANTSSTPVKITTSNLPSNSYVGKPMQEYKMQATGGSGNYSWFSQNLPPGLKMNIDGTISGTPTQLGSFDVVFAVMDDSTPAYIDEVTLTYTIPTDLTITTTSIPGAQVMVDYSTQISNTGGLPPYTWSIVAGQPPIGLSIDPSSGLLAGLPCTYNSTTDFSKTFSFTVQVKDAIGAIASKNYNMTLTPATLQFGLLNQPTVIATEDFKLTVPVFGGKSPYSNLTFSDNGVVGSGLKIVNPDTVSAIAGITPPTLTIDTTDQNLYPASYPANVAFFLSASGGVPSSAGLPNNVSYKFLVDTTANNTLPGAICYGPLLVASPAADGAYTVTIKAIDSVGHSVSKTLNVTVQRQGAGQYTLKACTINTNGTPTNPNNWTVTPLPAGFPDPKNGTAYSPGANQYYAVVLYDTGVKKLSNGANPAISASIINGSLPTGLTMTSANSQFSTTGADCVILIQGTATTNAGYSWLMQFQGIINGSNVAVATAQRFTQTVTTAGGGNTPVVAITQTGEIDLDLNTLVPNSAGSFSWAYPLLAEGGTGPYTFSIVGGTLPGLATQVSINNLPAFSSATTQVNNAGTFYTVQVQAKDSNNVTSATATIKVVIDKSNTQPIHILTNNIPAYLYVNRPIPANTYYVDADLAANWSATGLPAGVTLSNATGTRVYLAGTPTGVGQNTVNITATSATYGTSDTAQVGLEIRAQAVSIIAPSHTGATATIGQQYRVVNNNAIVSVQYTGFQPSDVGLPILQNSLGTATLGAPGVTIGGQPTTGNRSLTADGFIMDYDYLPTGSGSDTLSFSNPSFPDSLVITEVYPTLVATASPVTQNVSEYAVTTTLPLPVQITGGSAPYTISVSGQSDSRFVPHIVGGSATGMDVTISSFAAGASYPCSVNMVVTDSAGQTASVTGQITLTVIQETSITVTFQDLNWSFSASNLVSASKVLNQTMSIPQLGHPPYKYDVTSVSTPVGLTGFIVASPTNRVIAYNLTVSPASVVDVDNTLTPTGFFTVNPGVAPSPGTYQITVGLKVTDSKGIISTATQHVNITITA